jgi:hypothetical protein
MGCAGALWELGSGAAEQTWNQEIQNASDLTLKGVYRTLVEPQPAHGKKVSSVEFTRPGFKLVLEQGTIGNFRHNKEVADGIEVDVAFPDNAYTTKKQDQEKSIRRESGPGQRDVGEGEVVARGGCGDGGGIPRPPRPRAGCPFHPSFAAGDLDEKAIIFI